MIHEKDHWRTEDDFGIMMPWYTRPCLQWLDSQKLEGKRVFEYGSGYSALWWRSRGCVVEGVDDQKEWADLAGVRHIEDKKTYLESINWKQWKGNKFDIICIDGSFRDECLFYALNSFTSTKNGFIVIDNWEQASADLLDWPKTQNIITDQKLNHTVYKEPLHQDWKTLVIHP